MRKVVLKKIESVDKLVEHVDNGDTIIYADGEEFAHTFILNTKLSELLGLIYNEKIYVESE